MEIPGEVAAEASRWTVAERPRVNIGVLDGEAAYRLSRVRDVVRLSNGTLVVAHDEPPELRFYDSAGTHLRTVGGEGGGPGEFRGMAELLRLPGDTLLVRDPSLERLSRFAPDGTFLGSTRIEVPRTISLVGRFEDGTLVVDALVPGPGDQGGAVTGIRTRTRALVAVSREGLAVDTLATRPGREHFVSRTAGKFLVIRRLFGTRPHQATGPDALYEGHSARWEVRTRDPDGELRRIVRLDRDRPRVTAEQRDSALEAATAGLEDPDFRRRIGGAFRETPLPERHPAFHELRRDAAGNLWLRERREGGRWIVLAPDGGIRAVASLPPRFDPLDIDREVVTGRWRGELDVPRVRVYRLQKDVRSGGPS